MFKVTYVKCATVYKLAASSKNVSEGVDPVFPNKWVSKKGFSLPGLFFVTPVYKSKFSWGRCLC